MSSWLTTSEAAARLGIDPATVRRAVRDGKLDAIATPGGHWRIDPADLAGYLAHLTDEHR